MSTGRRRGSSDGPVIASVALNDLRFDDRVHRVAGTLAAHGAQVIALGLTSEDEGWTEDRSGVEVRVVAGPIRSPRASALRRVQRRLGNGADRLRIAQRMRRDRAKASAEEARQRVRSAPSGQMRERARAASRRAKRHRKRVHRGLRARANRTVIRSMGAGAKWLGSAARPLDLRKRAGRRRAIAARLARELAAISPDAIHANDADGLSVAAAAARRLESAVIVYDAHEWTVGRQDYLTPPGGAPSEVDLEREAIHGAAAVVTVSDVLAGKLEAEHHLSRRPIVLWNTPRISWSQIDCPSLTQLADLPPDCRIAVYAGNITPVRGLPEAVTALASFGPDLHLVLLGRGSARHVSELFELAERHGVAEQFHHLEPVPPEHVVPTIRSATLGLMPFRRNRNVDVAMPNKLFQYLHAGLPMVVSDCTAASTFVREHDLGEVFSAEDPAALAEAMGRVTARLGELRESAADPELRRTYSWEAQEERLVAVYRELGVVA